MVEKDLLKWLNYEFIWRKIDLLKIKVETVRPAETWGVKKILLRDRF